MERCDEVVRNDDVLGVGVNNFFYRVSSKIVLGVSVVRPQTELEIDE